MGEIWILKGFPAPKRWNIVRCQALMVAAPSRFFVSFRPPAGVFQNATEE